MFLRKKITRSRIKHFLEKHRTDARTLDIGCSTPTYTAEYFPNRTGIDIDPSKNPDVVGDAHALPFPDNDFEAILCTEVLEHLHDPMIAVSEMRRVLKPDGVLILTTRFIYPLHDSPHDYFRYTKYGLRHLFKDWEIVELSSETNTMETFAVLLETLASKADLRGGKFTRALFILAALTMRSLSWLLKEERASGTHGPKVVEDHLMTSGYYLVCKNSK